MKPTSYEKYPFIPICGTLKKGWNHVLEELKKQTSPNKNIWIIDCYTGTNIPELKEHFSKVDPVLLIETSQLMKKEEEVIRMTAPFMTDDILFGYLSNLQMTDYFNPELLAEARKKITETNGLIIVLGYGASLVYQNPDLLIYNDMARWEIIQRFRRQEAVALGIDNRQETASLQYKRGYFNDWKICDQHKDQLFQKVDYWLDTHIPQEPKLIDRNTFMKGIEKASVSPFRVVPFFDPAPWGGQWMKETCGLNHGMPNYGWCFDCVPEENSLCLNVDGELFEMPSINLILLKSQEVLGEIVEARFGKEFPIRFDFLDTIEGGNLSLQVHPTTDYIHKHFGIQYTQDESYYLLDAKEGASVYLGLKNGIDPEEMIHDLKEAQEGATIFDTEKYVNKFPAKKHDHFLIPGGTIHCSGTEALVLEISSTPNLFTFKLWDWMRMGLDGKPRPINIDHGANVINWNRNTDYTTKHLVNVISTVAEGDGWKEEKTGLHPNEFIETRRHWFEKKVTHYTDGSVNVLNLVEGDEVIIESPTNAFDPYIIHYAETFIIPASVGTYTIAPYGKAIGKTCGTIKASVRI